MLKNMFKMSKAPKWANKVEKIAPKYQSEHQSEHQSEPTKCKKFFLLSKRSNYKW